MLIIQTSNLTVILILTFVFQAVFSTKIPSNKSASDFNLNSPTDYTFKEYKDTVQEALENKFGKSEVVRNDKCLTVKGNTYRVETDVVPSWKHRDVL